MIWESFISLPGRGRCDSARAPFFLFGATFSFFSFDRSALDALLFSGFPFSAVPTWREPKRTTHPPKYNKLFFTAFSNKHYACYISIACYMLITLFFCLCNLLLHSPLYTLLSLIIATFVMIKATFVMILRGFISYFCNDIATYFVYL